MIYLFFSVQGRGGSPTGPDPEIRVGDQDIRSPGKPLSSGLEVSGEPEHCLARTRLSWSLSSGLVTWRPFLGRFPCKPSFNCTSRNE